MIQPICLMREGISRQFTTFDAEKKSKVVSIGPKERRILAESNSTGIITRIWFTFPNWFWQHWDPCAKTDTTILRKLILRIYWDGNDFPSVEAPIGDFFGIGHCEYRQYTSKYLGMSSGGFYCYFPMPFEKGVKIEIENRHEDIDSIIFMNINYYELDSISVGYGRFHCMFNCGENPGYEPVEILTTSGKGHYAGCCVSIQGKEYNYFSYLEAPEYIYIDQEPNDPNPAIVGTGLEDYFNGGWYFRNGEFSGQLHGVPLKDNLRSMISMYRFHDTDAINFDSSIRFAFINPWDKDRLKPFVFSSTAYWYQDKASRLKFRLPGDDSLLNLYRIRDFDNQSIP